MKTMKFLFFIALSFISACSSNSSSPTAPPELPVGSLPIGELEYTTVVLESTHLQETSASISEEMISTIVKSLLADGEESENCHVESNGTGSDGQCLTPLNMTGYASSVALGLSSGGAPVRLFGSTVGSISLDRGGEMEVSPFNLAEPLDMQGTSNLQDAEDPDSLWDRLIVMTAVIDIKAQIKQKFWTVRFAFVSQQAGDEEALQECVDEPYLESILQYGGLLEEGETDGSYRKGDLLLCQKDLEDEECSDDDFQWLDLDTDQLTSVRPDNPLQHDWADNDEVECSDNNGEGYDISLGGYDLTAEIDEPFQLEGELDDCLKEYTTTDPASGEVSTGNVLSADFDFDMESAVYLEGITNGFLSSLSDAEILSAFNLKQIYSRDLQDDPGGISSDDAGISVAANITLSQNDSLTCTDGEDVASSLLPGDECSPDAEIKSSCSHEPCSDSLYDEVEDTVWSSSGGSCPTYCTIQLCDEYNGTFRAVYCTPDC